MDNRKLNIKHIVVQSGHTNVNVEKFNEKKLQINYIKIQKIN